jgi:heme-binding protein
VKTLKAPKWAVVVLGVVVIAAAAMQCVRPNRANSIADPSHTIRAQLATPNGLDSVLDRSCGDCHSNTISSRWYARVPPFSAVIARGANEGRKAVNFAEWSAYSPEQQRAFLVSSCADAKSGRMPMSAYLRVRPDAKLSARDVETICGASR